MTVQTIALDKPWAGDRPTKAWIMLIGESAGRALDIHYSACNSYTGSIDIDALMATRPTGAVKYRNRPNDNPTPTALSLNIDEDMYLGFVLEKRLGASFAAKPFSGGYASAADDWMQVTRIDDRHAYLIVRGSSFNAKGCNMPFNIHLLAKGTFSDGVEYGTPIIIDPEGRIPDGTVPG